MAVNKIKRGKAVSALIASGMAPSTAARYVRMLDLDKPLAPQIAELAEDMADLFGATDADDSETDAEESMTAREAQAARLLGNSEHLQRRTFRRTAQERPSTAPATAQEAAAHLLKNSGRNTPPTQRWVEPVRDINAGLKPQDREPSAGAKRIADRLRGN